MRQVSAHEQFFEPARSAGLDPLLVHMRTTFQPMRIIVVQPGRQVPPVNSSPAGELIETVPVERNNLRIVPPPARHRKLFNEPGQWRVVTWGDFKEILAPQLAHPERLRDTYRLPCYVQVVETNRDVTIDELAEEFSTKDARPKPLYFLTDEIAAKLELTSLLPPVPPRKNARTPNVLSAHERVFRLLVANDPTVDVGNFKKQSESKLKTSIPNSFIKEWEFKISREEALYDINECGLFSTLRKLARGLRVFKQHSEFRKWQTLIAGKSNDDQLWSVRPPAKMLDHAFVRDWLKKTLDAGGYDSELMIREWEIFWRRKGV